MADATPAQAENVEGPKEGTHAEIIENAKSDMMGQHPLDPTPAQRRGHPAPTKLDEGPRINSETGGYAPAAYKKVRHGGTDNKKKFEVIRKDN